MRKPVLPTLATLLIVALVAMGTTHAGISHDPASPIGIPYDQGIDFSMIGSRAGACAYYSIEYPGDGRIITIELDLAPGDPGALPALGFNVYGPYAYLIGSGVQSLTKMDRKILRWADRNPARWLIQVYNYLEGVPANFHLQVTGLANPTPTPTPEPMAMAAYNTLPPMAFGGLIGNRGGSYQCYIIESTGDGSEVALRLYYTPDNEWVSNGFGLNVYGPRDGILVARAGHETRFRRDLPGTYLVQVYNYIHGLHVTYVLTKE